VLLAPTAAGTRVQPVRVIIASGTSVEAAVALSDAGQYVAVDLHNIDTHAAENGEDRGEANDTTGISIYQSVLETARRHQIPSIIIDDLFRIYSSDFDFQRNVQPGDNFELLFVDEAEKPSSVNHSRLLYAALTVGGETQKYYRYQLPNENSVEYYDESGKGAKRLLVRNPTIAGFVSSGFGLRRDPILGDTRMHTGVDLAAPTGTPIHASGDGVVKMIGWESGYGKYIRIGHTNRYETAYGHMTAFARGIEIGTRVRRGQVIGFVGSTGYSTGPHLHYEILADGRFVDPMHANLPRERVLLGPMLTSFEREREEVDNLNNDLASRASLVASMQPLAD
jgi:murein DD-endopeptidase MepM/ murein hydrolase activator NlpD